MLASTKAPKRCPCSCAAVSDTAALGPRVIHYRWWRPTSTLDERQGHDVRRDAGVQCGESSVVVQSRTGWCVSSRSSVAAAARCTACHGVAAHAEPAVLVNECSNPLGKNVARQPRRRTGAARDRSPGAPSRPRRRRCRATCRAMRAGCAAPARNFRGRRSRARPGAWRDDQARARGYNHAS